MVEEKIPDGCEQCPLNKKREPKAWGARYAACIGIGLFVATQCYSVSYGKPYPQPGSTDVKIGGLYLETREPPYLLVGVSMLAVGALLEVPMGAIARVLSGGKSND